MTAKHQSGRMHQQRTFVVTRLPQQPNTAPTRFVPQDYVLPNTTTTRFVPQDYVLPNTTTTRYIPQDHVQPNNTTTHLPQHNVLPDNTTMNAVSPMSGDFYNFLFSTPLSNPEIVVNVHIWKKITESLPHDYVLPNPATMNILNS
jgi:hypothetical protein